MLTAKFPGTCRKSGRPIRPGDPIERCGRGWALLDALSEQERRFPDGITIEPGGHGATYHHTDGFTVYGHGTFGSGTLAGRPSRTFLNRFETLADAQRAYPDARVIAGTSYNAYDTYLSRTPPADFDPLAAGEVWDETDY